MRFVFLAELEEVVRRPPTHGRRLDQRQSARQNPSLRSVRP